LGYLNFKGFRNIIICDQFGEIGQNPNLEGKSFTSVVERDMLFKWLAEEGRRPDAVFHLGARTDTTEFDYEVHRQLNLEYSKRIWEYCTHASIPLVYASSAATYGAGERGYHDDPDRLDALRPLNPYGRSKHEFDLWVTERPERERPPFWAGLKFFNVYGPNEYHKGRMASVIFHAFGQIQKEGKVRLFRSHRPNYKDGQQQRDFIYVADVARVCLWMMEERPASGIYNLGTGKARTFEALARATFAGMDRDPVIEYIDMPADLRETYQYFTEADMGRLRAAGYAAPFHSLEDGVGDYVRNYLVPGRYY
jgi:ADP-L-glycero-D-manno-heptose 6-epimerase